MLGSVEKKRGGAEKRYQVAGQLDRAAIGARGRYDAEHRPMKQVRARRFGPAPLDGSAQDGVGPDKVDA